MKKGERVRWYLFASANEDDVHTVHWHGQTAVVMPTRTDAVPLTPMSMWCVVHGHPVPGRHFVPIKLPLQAKRAVLRARQPA
ncbi:MAG: hypothetical protein WA188_20320 [Terriglobales bacterium]